MNPVASVPDHVLLHCLRDSGLIHPGRCRVAQIMERQVGDAGLPAGGGEGSVGVFLPEKDWCIRVKPETTEVFREFFFEPGTK
jgi:hypothetical protein